MEPAAQLGVRGAAADCELAGSGADFVESSAHLRAEVAKVRCAGMKANLVVCFGARKVVKDEFCGRSSDSATFRSPMADLKEGQYVGLPTEAVELTN